MTDHATDTDRRGTDDRPTLAETDHTNPHTGEVFGATQMYNRGRTIAADGGEANDGSRASSEPRSDGGEANGESRASSELRSDGGDADEEQLATDGGEASDASRGSSELPSDGGEASDTETREQLTDD